MVGFNKAEYVVSEYNENMEEYIAYYLNEAHCEAGDIAYMYREEDKAYSVLRIVHCIKRSAQPVMYDKMIRDDDVLIAGEVQYKADTSAEFITDNDCYLVWFVYV